MVFYFFFFIFVRRKPKIMKPIVRYLLPNSLSARLSLWVMLFVAILFLATFSLMFYYARQAVRVEAEGKAEDMLQKMEIAAANTLHEKEVVARQTFWNVEQNLHNPDAIDDYLQEILRNTPEIVGVAVAFVPDYYQHRPGEYMIYYYRKGTQLIKSETFADESYMHQPWYEETLNRNTEYWSDPAENYKTNGEPIISFGLPLHKDGKAVGVFAIDISLYWLSKVIEEKRPSPNMYGVIASRKGAFIVHPDTTLLKPGALFKLMEQFPGAIYSSLAYKMLDGETGTASAVFNGVKSFIAYKPMEGTQWVVDVVCPEEEVMASYNQLISLMILIVVLALMAIAAFFYFFIHKELLPLRTLEASAKQMIKGDYFAPVTTNNRQDEVGILTNSFVAMRRSIRNHLNKIDRNREKLDEQNKALNEAHQHVKEADRVKTAFLQNMTDQMSEPVLEITKIVNDVREHLDVMEHEQIVKLADQMDGHTNTITALLDRMLEVATKEEKEEESE